MPSQVPLLPSLVPERESRLEADLDLRQRASSRDDLLGDGGGDGERISGCSIVVLIDCVARGVELA